MVKYLVAQDTQFRFQWELDVLLTNLYGLDPKAQVVLLFAVKSDDDPVVAHVRNKWGNKADIHCYFETRHTNRYVAATRPFLWYCYLKEDPTREQDTYFQIDSDVIFRELPDFSKIPLSENYWAGSDCSRYLDYKYLMGCKDGAAIVDGFSSILQIERTRIELTEGAGAQWILVKPTAEYWLKVQSDCHKLSDFLDAVDSDVQKWCAEMWAQLLNAPLFGAEYHISKELDFCNPVDPAYRWDEAKILHNAGVIAANKHLSMDKNAYRERAPFGEDFSWVSQEHTGIHYVNAINAV